MLTKQATPKIEPSAQPINFNWEDNLAVKNLLDIITSILAEEYINVAKSNPEIFK